MNKQNKTKTAKQRDSKKSCSVKSKGDKKLYKKFRATKTIEDKKKPIAKKKGVRKPNKKKGTPTQSRKKKEVGKEVVIKKMDGKKKKKPFTLKQQLFIKEYPLDFNGTKSAERAGFSKKTCKQQASRLLTNVDIQEAVLLNVDERMKNADLSVQWVLERLKQIVERCMQETPVMRYDSVEKKMVHVKDGEGKNVWQFNSMGANKALELIGRFFKMYTDKMLLENDPDNPVSVGVVNIYIPDNGRDKT